MGPQVVEPWAVDPGDRHHDGTYDLAPLRVGHADHGHVGHAGVVEQHSFPLQTAPPIRHRCV
jgi:hypothetical protein